MAVKQKLIRTAGLAPPHIDLMAICSNTEKEFIAEHYAITNYSQMTTMIIVYNVG